MMSWFTGPALPWILLGLILAVGGAGTTGYMRGRGDGRDALIAEQARDAATRKEAQAEALQAAAKEIAKVKVVSQTINRELETVIREKPVYRDCVNEPAVERLLDDARANRPPSESAGPVSVP